MVHLYRFTPFELPVERGELLRREAGETRPLHLPPQPFRVLLYLLQRAGRLVTRDELASAIWTEDVFVDQDLGLNHCIRRLRRILEDDASQPRFIRTVTRRGYRFVAEVEVEPGPEVPEVPEDHDAPAAASRPRVENLRIGVLRFANYAPELVERCFGYGLAEEVLREVFRVTAPETRILALHRFEGAHEAPPTVSPDLILTGSVRFESGLLRVLAYLIRAHDGVILETSVWQSRCEHFGLETQVQAAEFLVESLLHQLAGLRLERPPAPSPILATSPVPTAQDRRNPAAS